ncbi:PPR domain-containing protein/PPR_2 domain-containing protein [Cephalotus follicularis]|uniref:PPR domain-containing protein/PPR_2 domain-containing protein n=1 Tax=Cephalotus follicularis TaxID=3775 RepID=A0A1Q3B677_CEPFO|nr:PPR domain-containing protein/PPR_2 domain-containing protein [Cephalotus follicularis]
MTPLALQQTPLSKTLSRLLRHYRDTGYIPRGRAVHAKFITSGSYLDVYANNNLLSMYLKFHRLRDARYLFDKMPGRNVVSWSVLISGYSQMGMEEEAFECLGLMVSDGFEPNEYTYVAAVSACASVGDARAGREIHGRIYRSELEFNDRVSNCLVNMYGKCGFLKSAKMVFDESLEPNSISWTSLLSSYIQCGENLKGLQIFLESQRAGVSINEFSCTSAFGACAALEYLKVGMQVHSLVLKCGHNFDKFVISGLINFYAKCGEMVLANQAFLEVNQPHPSAWTALVGGYVHQGKGREAIDLFLKLQYSGLKPSDRTFSSVLGAFTDAMDIEVGKQLHSLIIRMGFSSFTYVGNAVLDFYSKCGHLEDSYKIFQEIDVHDVVTWNALISGHVRSGQYGEAIEHLKNMLVEGHDPNIYTYSSILSICSDLSTIEWGKQMHCRIIKPGFDSNVVIGSTLIDMYAKCGRLSDARKVFDNLTSKNLVSWNTILVGYAHHGFGREALEIYSLMQINGVKPNDITLLGVTTACGHVGLLEEGWHHFNNMITDHGIAPKMEHLAAMVSLFARKGQTSRAYEIIKSFPMEPNKVVWRCLLSGCKTHKDLALGKHAAEKILSIDAEDASAHVVLYNLYAEAKMWDETAEMRRMMKEKALKKETGYSWAELKSKIYFFYAGNRTELQGSKLCKVIKGLTAQLFDAGYVPDAMFSLQ